MASRYFIRVGPSRPTAPGRRAVDGDRRDDERTGEQRFVAVFGPDRDRESLVEDVLDERDDEQFLLEDCEDLVGRFRRRRRPRPPWTIRR